MQFSRAENVSLSALQAVNYLAFEKRNILRKIKKCLKNVSFLHTGFFGVLDS